MITIRCSARYCVDREDVGGGKEKRNITVIAHLVFTNFHPTSVTERPLPHHTVREHYLEFVNGGLPIENTRRG
jgi:hypothetical protein